MEFRVITFDLFMFIILIISIGNWIVKDLFQNDT